MGKICMVDVSVCTKINHDVVVHVHDHILHDVAAHVAVPVRDRQEVDHDLNQNLIVQNLDRNHQQHEAAPVVMIEIVQNLLILDDPNPVDHVPVQDQNHRSDDVLMPMAVVARMAQLLVLVLDQNPQAVMVVIIVHLVVATILVHDHLRLMVKIIQTTVVTQWMLIKLSLLSVLSIIS